MSENKIRVPVTKLVQKNIISYIGKMKARHVLALYDIRHFREAELDGYQRKLYNERQKEIASYLKDSSIPLISTVLASLKGPFAFISENGDSGYLELPLKRGCINLIDGQHRMSGFSWFMNELSRRAQEKNLGIEIDSQAEEIAAYERILDYEVPIQFLDSVGASEVLAENLNPESTQIDEVFPDDVERVVFYVVNKTQKGIRPSLQDTLKYLIYRAGIRGIPSIEKDPWRVDATEFGHKLNRPSAPLAGKINLSGARGLGRPLQLNSWVTSLQPLFTDSVFNDLSRDSQYDFVKDYWTILGQIFHEEFIDKNNYLLLKSIGVYSLNWLAPHIINWITATGREINEDSIREYLVHLEGFNWKSKVPNPSELRGLGGQAGVKEAYKILLQYMVSTGLDEAETLYSSIIAEEERRNQRQ